MGKLSRLAKDTLGIFDPLLAIGALAAAPIVVAVSRARGRARISRAIFDRVGISLVPHHYYEPVTLAKDLRHSCDDHRPLPGIDLRTEAQLALLTRFEFAAELQAIPRKKTSPLSYGYDNSNYGIGDAEMLYNMLRTFKPRRMIEIGSGQSTLVARMAILKNRESDPAYACRHVCIEPYEQPWLEKAGVEVVRSRVELLPVSTFAQLEAGDILFIDSSHVIRPQGDVLYEFLEVLPTLKSGVFVHIHDIRTPRDYPTHWITDIRRMWAEQYLMEAFLSNNPDFEIIAASNMLAADFPDQFAKACPVWGAARNREPSSFWIRRV